MQIASGFPWAARRGRLLCLQAPSSKANLRLTFMGLFRNLHQAQ